MPRIEALSMCVRHSPRIHSRRHERAPWAEIHRRGAGAGRGPRVTREGAGGGGAGCDGRAGGGLAIIWGGRISVEKIGFLAEPQGRGKELNSKNSKNSKGGSRQNS